MQVVTLEVLTASWQVFIPSNPRHPLSVDFSHLLETSRRTEIYRNNSTINTAEHAATATSVSPLPLSAKNTATRSPASADSG